jgi:hypothetical protein
MAFNVPINSIAPIPTPPDWVRPSDWVAITDTPNEVQFLVADTGTKAFTIRTTFTRTSGNIYIDWGDGTIDTITTVSSIDTSHIYSTGGTPCSRGYNTWKIRIYGDATCVITNARHIPNFSATGGSPYYGIGLLEAYFGDGTCSTSAFFANYFTSYSTTLGFGNFMMLEYVKLPATVSWTSQMQNMFQTCNNLYVVVMPTSASSLSILNLTFNGCYNLLDIVFPSNATKITQLSSVFSSCQKLRSVTLPATLNSCTTMASAFNGCVALKNITLPSINLLNSLQTTFAGCFSLQWVKITSMPAPVSTGTAVTFSGAFQTCTKLQNIYLPNSCSSNAIYDFSNAFNGCNNLKNIVLPTNFNASVLSGCFSACNAITSITFQSAMPNLANLSSAFSTCYSLKNLTLPTTVASGGINISQAFNQCWSLESITIPSGWLITSLANTFNGCVSVTSITLPNNSQNSITSMATAFQQCYRLSSIVLPTSLNALTTLNSAFSNCYVLSSITLPSSLGAVTNMGSTFFNCFGLLSITLPTSMPNCLNFTSTFSNCYSITSITLPSTISASLSAYSNLVSGCFNLKTLTLPTTQTSAVTSINQMFFGCGNLTTINNLDKVGSLTSTPLVGATMTNGSASFSNLLTSLSFNCPFSQLSLNGNSTTQNFNKLNSLRLLNASAGQYTGSSPQINVSFCDLGITALNQLFTDLPVVVGKTINITSCTGAAGCTRTIATTKGWTVTG